MPSDAFIGILSGLGEAHRTRQKNIFDQEVERRSKYEQFLQKAATDPAYRPEAQEQFGQLYSTLIQTPYEKKLPKDFERQVTDALTSVEGTMDKQQGGPPQTSQAPAPKGLMPTGEPETAPPPGKFQGQMPARFSAEEKFAEAMRLLNAQLQARGASELETEKAKLPLQVEAERQRQKAEQEFAPTPAPKGFGSSPLGIYSQDTGEISSAAPPDLTLEEQAAKAWLAQNPGKTVNDYQTMDANRRRPITNVNLDRLRELNLENITNASPGQVVFKNSGRPVGQQMPETAAVRLEGLQTAIEQADVVEQALLALGNTGAVKGFIEENGVYWPVVQDQLSPAQAEAVAETNRLLSAYAQAVSGLAVSEQEIGRLRRSAPSVRLTPEANKKIVGHFRRNAQTKLNNYLDLRGWKLSDAAGAPTPPPSTGSSAGPSEQQIQAEMKANPDYTRQEIIDALKAAGVR